MCFSFIIVQQKYTGLTYTSGNSGNWPNHFVRASCSFHKFKLYVKKHRNLLQKKNDAFAGCKEVLYNSLPLLMREKNTGSAYISRSCIFLMHIMVPTAMDKSLLTRPYLPSRRGLTGSLSAASMSFSQL